MNKRATDKPKSSRRRWLSGILAVLLAVSMVPAGVFGSAAKAAYADATPLSAKSWDEVKSQDWMYGRAYSLASWDCVAYVKTIVNSYYQPTQPIIAYTCAYLAFELAQNYATAGTDYASFMSLWNSGGIKPGDIIITYASGTANHAGIISDQTGTVAGASGNAPQDQTVPTINNSTPAFDGSCRQSVKSMFDYGFGQGGDKGFDRFEIYRGLSEGAYLGIQKTSTNPTLSTGNRVYTLAGAVYGVYASSANATADTSRLETLTTGADGKATSTAKYDFGTYYVKEISAPAGFLLDAQVWTVTVSASTKDVNDVVWKTVTDSPGNDPVDALVRKVDAATGLGVAQGSASLAGAEFTVKYFDGYYTIPGGNYNNGTVATPADDYVDPNPSGYPSLSPDYGNGVGTAATRTWVFRTEASGIVRLSNTHYVGGDALYLDLAGYPVFPFGTYVLYETKAPTGYLLPATSEKYVTRIIHDPTNTAGYNKAVNKRQSEVGTSTSLLPYEDIEGAGVAKVGNEASLQTKQSELVILADIGLYKSHAGASPGTLVPESGLVFDFYGSRQYSGALPLTSATPAFSLTTDTDGYASTKEIYVVDNFDDTSQTGNYTVTTYPTQQARDSATGRSGGIPFDTYLVVQRTTTPGYDLVPPFLWKVEPEASTDAVYYQRFLQDSAVQAAIRIIKTDSTTGLQVPYPATWQIIDTATGSPVSMVVRYPNPVAITEFSSDAQGRLVLPEMLGAGNYQLKEVLAPANTLTGYVRSDALIDFSVGSSSYNWDSPLEVTFADAPQMARIRIEKTDAGVRGGAVAGAHYTVKAKTDISTLDGTLRASAGEVVATLITDANGKEITGELYLGTYTVEETSAPEGYETDTSIHEVALTYAGQDTAVYVSTISLTNKPTTFAVKKLDASALSALPGATFSLTAEDFRTYDKAAIESAVAGLCASASTGTSTYHYTATPKDAQDIAGADLNTLLTFTISKEEGGITTELELTMVFETDHSIRLASDELGEATISWLGAAPAHYTAVSNASGELSFSYLAHGKWTLKEESAPPGYLREARIWEFVVDEKGTIEGFDGVLVITNRAARIDILVIKRDQLNESELAGARLEVYRINAGVAEATPAYEWVSDGSPHRINDIQVGDYLLHEASAPTGYALAQDIPFTITAELALSGLELIIEDEPIGALITKLDSYTGRALAGARLQVFDQKQYTDWTSGKTVNEPRALIEWASTSEPRFLALVPGSYTLVEAEAPKGYLLAKPLDFVVKDSGTTRVVMYDEPEGRPWDKTGVTELPAEPKPPYLATTLFGALPLAVLSVALSTLRKRSPL